MHKIMWSHLLSCVFVTLSFSCIGFINAQEQNCRSCFNQLCPICQKCPNACPPGYFTARGLLCIEPTTVKVLSTDTITSESTIPSTTQLPLTTTFESFVTCEKCPMDNCTACTNSTVCDSCTTGYILTSNYTCQIDNGTKPEGGSDKKNGSIIGGVVGGVIGGLVLIGLIVLAVVCLRRRHTSRDVNKTKEVDEEDGRRRPEQHGQKMSTKLELKEDIERTHDKITRYARDPTEKKGHNDHKDLEADELYNLPEAPEPPKEKNYDGLEVTCPKSSGAYTPFPMGAPDEDQNVYANNATIMEAIEQTDSLYINTATLKEEANHPANGGEHSSISNIARDKERQDEVDEPQEIYMNDNSQLITATDEGESEEVYVNEEAEEEDIYLNVPK